MNNSLDFVSCIDMFEPDMFVAIPAYDHSTIDTDSVYYEGWLAAQDEITVYTSCPYDESSPEYECWMDGYDSNNRNR